MSLISLAGMASFKVSVRVLTNSEDFRDEDFFFMLGAATLVNIVLASEAEDTCTDDGIVAWLALVLMVSLSLLDVDDDEDDDVPDDGSSSPAMSAVGRVVGEDESNEIGCCDVDDGVEFEAGPNLLSIAEFISSRKKELKPPLIHSLSSFLFFSILSLTLFIVL